MSSGSAGFFCHELVVGRRLRQFVTNGYPFRLAGKRRGTIRVLTSFLFSHSGSKIFLLHKCTKANGASILNTLIQTLIRLGQGAILVTPAKETTGIFTVRSKGPTFAVRGHVCHRGAFSGRVSGFLRGIGLLGRTFFVISRTSVVSKASKNSLQVKNANYLLSSLIRFICSKRKYQLVLIKSSTRLPPIKRRLDPTLSHQTLRTCNLRM